MLFSKYYEYDDRFFEFRYDNQDEDDTNISGIYDTKERRVILAPSIEEFEECSEDEILVEKRCDENESGYPEYSHFFINSKGETLYPWLIGKDFAFIDRPNQSRLSIVAVY